MQFVNLFHYFLFTIRILPNVFSTFDSFEILVFLGLPRGDKETFFKAIFLFITERKHKNKNYSYMQFVKLFQNVIKKFISLFSSHN